MSLVSSFVPHPLVGDSEKAHDLKERILFSPEKSRGRKSKNKREKCRMEESSTKNRVTIAHTVLALSKGHRHCSSALLVISHESHPKASLMK